MRETIGEEIQRHNRLREEYRESAWILFMAFVTGIILGAGIVWIWAPCKREVGLRGSPTAWPITAKAGEL